MKPFVSVVVPTRDRATKLSHCLGALSAQEGCPNLEIIVVDDGSHAHEEVSLAASALGVRVVRTDRAGPATARNAGVQAAAGEVILLTDDDCIPDPHWAAILAREVVSGPADAVGGRTVPMRQSRLLVATELIVEHLALETPFAATNNLGCRRALLLDEPFDERFPVAAGEDREWCARVWRSGRTLAHETSAIVRHDPEPGLSAFWRRHVRYGLAARRLGMLDSADHRPPGWSFYLRLLRRGFERGLGVGFCVLLSQMATIWGYTREGTPSRGAPRAGAGHGDHD